MDYSKKDNVFAFLRFRTQDTLLEILKPFPLSRFVNITSSFNRKWFSREELPEWLFNAGEF